MDANLKYELIEKLVQTDDDIVLNQIKEILEGNDFSFWNDLNPALKESIQRGLEQSKQDEGTDHNEVMKNIKARLVK